MIFLTIFLLVIIIGYPVWDHFYMKKVDQGLINKRRMFGEIMIVQWITVGILLLFLFFEKIPLSKLFYLDQISTSFQFEEYKSILIGMAIGGGVGIVVALLAVNYSKSLGKKFREALGADNIQFLLPKTIGERVLFLFVAITAGVCEEIIFRGVTFYYLNHLPFDLSIIIIGIISSILFGIVHLYQGFKGVILTAFLGGGLFCIFIFTGSLWIPILLHILIDAKFVFLPNKSKLETETIK